MSSLIILIFILIRIILTAQNNRFRIFLLPKRQKDNVRVRLGPAENFLKFKDIFTF